MATGRVLDRVAVPGGARLVLRRAGEVLAIEADGELLMSSADHASEDALGAAVGARLAAAGAPAVLIGGLGLGYTLRAALDRLPAAARVTVAELVPEVVRWNREVAADLAGRPLDDPRVTVVVGDVAAALASEAAYDAILLDVDNGPDALTHAGNARLYTRAGLARARAALRPGGLLAVWSSFPSETFTAWLAGVGFEVRLERAPTARPRGRRYYIWMATRAEPGPG